MSDSYQTTLRKWLDDAARNDVTVLAVDAHEAHSAFIQECIDRLTGPLNEMICNAKQDTWPEKVALAKRINAILEPLHLGILCSTTGRVGALTVQHMTKSNRTRFALHVRKESGGFTTSNSRVRLAAVQLGARRSR